MCVFVDCCLLFISCRVCLCVLVWCLLSVVVSCLLFCVWFCVYCLSIAGDRWLTVLSDPSYALLLFVLACCLLLFIV